MEEVKMLQLLSDNKVDEPTTLIASINKKYSIIKQENETIKTENIKLNEKVNVLHLTNILHQGSVFKKTFRKQCPINNCAIPYQDTNKQLGYHTLDRRKP